MLATSFLPLLFNPDLLSTGAENISPLDLYLFTNLLPIYVILITPSVPLFFLGTPLRVCYRVGRPLPSFTKSVWCVIIRID